MPNCAARWLSFPVGETGSLGPAKRQTFRGGVGTLGFPERAVRLQVPPDAPGRAIAALGPPPGRRSPCVQKEG